MEVLTACVLHVVCIKRKKKTAPVNASINTILVNRGLIPAPIAQWLSHLLMGWKVLGSHLGTGSNPEQVLKGPMDRCKVTTPSSFSLTSNRVTLT